MHLKINSFENHVIMSSNAYILLINSHSNVFAIIMYNKLEQYFFDFGTLYIYMFNLRRVGRQLRIYHGTLWVAGNKSVKDVL